MRHVMNHWKMLVVVGLTAIAARPVAAQYSWSVTNGTAHSTEEGAVNSNSWGRASIMYNCENIFDWGHFWVAFSNDGFHANLDGTATIVFGGVTGPLRAKADADGDLMYHLKLRELKDFHLMNQSIRMLSFRGSEAIHDELASALKLGSYVFVGIPTNRRYVSEGGNATFAFSLRGSSSAITRACR